MTADEILAIPGTRPERLFSAPAAIDQEFRELAREWHPDGNADPRATEVTAHLSLLRIEAHRRVKGGTWRNDDFVTIRTVEGRSFRIRYEMERTIETGMVYYGHNVILWVITAPFADLASDAKDRIENLSFGSPSMGAEMGKYLPTVAGFHHCADGSVALVLRKTDDVFMLDDIRAAVGGKLDPRHVAWMVSGAYNIACYFEFAGLCHGGLTLENLFASPKRHSVMVFGGWWYAARVGEPLKALPRSIHSIVPPDIIRERKATTGIDTMSIRAIGRALLGDPTGMTLQGAAPDPMVRFLRSPASPSAHDEYSNWQKAIGESFGARRFVDLNISASDIFKKEK